MHVHLLVFFHSLVIFYTAPPPYCQKNEGDSQPSFYLWVLDFLFWRVWSVRCGSDGMRLAVFSSSRSICARVLQGTVISPFLYTSYTHDCCNENSTSCMMKFFDNILDDMSYFDVEYFVMVQHFLK